MDLPGRGPVLDGISLSARPGEVTALVGRTGSGVSTLLRRVAEALPPGTTGRGRVTWRDRALPTPRGRLVAADWALAPGTVGAHLRCLTADVREAGQRFGLTDVLGQRLTQLPADLRARVHLATLSLADAAPLVLVDSVFTAATGHDREAMASEVRRRARAGAVVVWGEQDLNAVWQHADRIVELAVGRVRFDGDPLAWPPHQLPEPTLLILGRVFGLPATTHRDTAGAAAALRDRRLALPALPSGPKPHHGDPISVRAADLELDGEDLTLGTRECIGVVERSGRAEPLARTLARRLRGATLVTGHLPPLATPRRLARAWERHHALSTGSVLAATPDVRPDQPLALHGSGDLARLRVALASGPESPVWLPHPQAGLDALDARRLAAALHSCPAGLRLLTSRDVEFLVRACHRILVVDGNRVVAYGSPNAVAEHLPEPPLVSRIVGSARHVRLRDVLEEAP